MPFLFRTGSTSGVTDAFLCFAAPVLGNVWFPSNATSSSSSLGTIWPCLCDSSSIDWFNASGSSVNPKLANWDIIDFSLVCFFRFLFLKFSSSVVDAGVSSSSSWNAFSFLPLRGLFLPSSPKFHANGNIRPFSFGSPVTFVVGRLLEPPPTCVVFRRKSSGESNASAWGRSSLFPEATSSISATSASVIKFSCVREYDATGATDRDLTFLTSEEGFPFGRRLSASDFDLWLPHSDGATAFAATPRYSSVTAGNRLPSCSPLLDDEDASAMPELHCVGGITDKVWPDRNFWNVSLLVSLSSPFSDARKCSPLAALPDQPSALSLISIFVSLSPG